MAIKIDGRYATAYFSDMAVSSFPLYTGSQIFISDINGELLVSSKAFGNNFEIATVLTNQGGLLVNIGTKFVVSSSNANGEQMTITPLFETFGGNNNVFKRS